MVHAVGDDTEPGNESVSRRIASLASSLFPPKASISSSNLATSARPARPPTSSATTASGEEGDQRPRRWAVERQGYCCGTRDCACPERARSARACAVAFQ